MENIKNEDVVTSETTEEETNSEELQAQIDKLTKENQGLKDQRRGLSKKVKENKKPSTVQDNDRLDRLELRQLDSELNAEQIVDILTIKKAKGIEDVNDAYNEPMVQAFLDKTRSEQGKKDRIDKAVPSSQGRNAESTGGSKTVSNSSNWVKEMPKESTEDVANALNERFFA